MRKVAALLVFVLLGSAPVHAARKPNKKKPDGHDKPPEPAPQSQFAAEAAVTHTLSLTITPMTTDGGITQADADRMLACESMLTALHVEFIMRHDDGQVPAAVISRERGEKDNGAHLQGAYDVTCSARSPAEIKALIASEKAWIKQICDAVTTLRIRIVIKLVNPRDRAYTFGYCQKDVGLAHYMVITVGLTAAELTDTLNIYRSSAGKQGITSKKMNKNPNAANKQCAFAEGNLFNLCGWFVNQHNLLPLLRVLSPAVIIAYAIQTTKYRVDDTLVTGRNRGATLDPARSHAFFQLVMTEDTSTGVTVPLIETVLYGSPQPHDDPANKPITLPSAHELATTWNLDKAKAFCTTFDKDAHKAACDMPRAPNGGRAIVIDFLNSNRAREAASVMHQAGLTVKTLLTSEQRPNQCGYNSAGWAVELRNLGTNFDALTLDTARLSNTALFVQHANDALSMLSDGTPLTGDVAEWLFGDDILRLASIYNPDGPATDASWLSGPGPMNYWLTHFSRTVADWRDHGRVHIMVVNTEATTGPITAAASRTGGAHWFVVAWLIERHQPRWGE